MAYTPKNWKDLPDETTPIQASDLNHIEQGIGDLNTSIGDLNTLNTTNKSSIVGAINEVYQNNVYSSDEKIAWKNPNTSVNFNEQTVTLNTSDYDFLNILYYDYRANHRMLSVTIAKGENANLSANFLTENQLYMSTRQMDYVDDNHYKFNNCSSITNSNITILNSSSPAQCIPAMIIAKKLNLS